MQLRGERKDAASFLVDPVHRADEENRADEEMQPTIAAKLFADADRLFKDDEKS